MLSTHELEVFVAAALAENFSVAAHRLHLSQPAVSLHVRNLERQLNVQLFQRNGRNVALTEMGKLLLVHAQEIVRQTRQLEELVKGLQGTIMGELCIACSTTVGKYILPRLIARFRHHFPDVQVSVNVMGRHLALEKLLDGSAEIAVVSRHSSHRDIDLSPFLEDAIVLIVPADHRWADGRSIDPAELRAEPMILREKSTGTHEVLAEGLADHGISLSELNIVMTLANAEAIEMSVEAGIGVAFVSRMAANRGLRLGCVVEVPVRAMSLTRQIYMVRQTRRSASPVSVAFWDFAFAAEQADLRGLPAQLQTQ